MKTMILICLLVAGMNGYSQKFIGSKFSGKYATLYPNPDYIHHPYNRILVNSGLSDAREDDKVLQEFSKIGIPVMSSLRLFPPVKEYSSQERAAVYQEFDIDGLINIQLKREETTNLGLSTTKRADVQLTLLDLKNNLNAVTVLGRTKLGNYSSLWDPDKVVVKFVRMVEGDLKPFVAK
jgi:hypothetical protein